VSVYQDIKDTLDSPGAKHIVKALRAYHKSQWRSLRKCNADSLPKVQAVMDAIDGALPAVITALMNKHVKSKEDQAFDFDEYAKAIRNKVAEDVVFDPLKHIKVKAAEDEGAAWREIFVPIGYDPSESCVKEPGPTQFYAVLPDKRIFAIIAFPFDNGIVYDGILRQRGLPPWRSVDLFS
jgi:hypothetical protein